MAIHYSVAGVDLNGLVMTGRAACEGGEHPRLPLHHYPLLAWTPEHPTFKGDVFTEDQKASVGAIAAAVAETPSFEALAERFGTTAAHVEQALDYAMECGVLKEGQD